MAHVPQARKVEVAARFRTVFTPVSADGAQRAAAKFRASFAKRTTVLAIFDAGIADALAFLVFPLEHHRKIATTYPI